MNKYTRKPWVIVLAGIGVLWVTAGCASQAPPADVPPWVNETPPDEALWGIGSAKQATMSSSMITAENRARTAVARQIDSKVQAMFIDYTQTAGAYVREAESAGDAGTLSFQEEISRNLTNLNLRTAVNQKWQAPDGTWWYRVECKKSDIKTAAAGYFNREAARNGAFKADEARKLMDAQLEKPNEKPVPVSR